MPFEPEESNAWFRVGDTLTEDCGDTPRPCCFPFSYSFLLTVNGELERKTADPRYFGGFHLFDNKPCNARWFLVSVVRESADNRGFAPLVRQGVLRVKVLRELDVCLLVRRIAFAPREDRNSCRSVVVIGARQPFGLHELVQVPDELARHVSCIEGKAYRDEYRAVPICKTV